MSLPGITSGEIPLVPPNTIEEKIAVRLFVAESAHDADDARLLLDALGLRGAL